MDSRAGKRLKAVIYFLAAAMVVLVLRLYYLQVMSGEVLAQEAQENIIRSQTVAAPRGNIYDRNGELLVKSVPVQAVAVEPRSVLASEDTLKFLSSNLEIGYDQLVKKLQETNISYLERIILAQDIDNETLIVFKENLENLPGVEIIDVFKREYNFDFLASHILGYTGEIDEEKLSSEQYKDKYEGGDQIGISGIEQYYEPVLKGVKGKVTYEVDPLGRPVSTVEKIDYIPGNDIYLTLDIELQRKVEEYLHQAIEDIRLKEVEKGSEETFKVTGGSVVILEADTGEVLSMASYPTYDPEVFIGGISSRDWAYLNDPENVYPLNNRSVMGYPPGSVFKIVTSYAGLAEEVIDENSRVTCTGTWYGLGRSFPKLCWNRSGHGSLNIYGGIKNSCDSFFYEIGLRLFSKHNNEEELLQKYSRLFGFGSKTGVDLPYEDAGVVPDREWKKEYFKGQVEKTVWYPGDTVNMSIGQGDLLVSPLQLAQSYMILANRGSYQEVHLLKDIKDYTGDAFLNVDTNLDRTIELNENYVDMIETGLDLVVSEGTAAYRFLGFPLDRIPIAGKTGTAEFAGRQDFAWFASYAPLDNPKYVVVAMLEEAGGGSSAAAPLVKDIYSYLFNLDNGDA
ncbi:MAG: penicillin-binding protein 2 [Actinomycetia bacterium]|nr:penicillin-binding protein 2 [Actinomycetes bacterium]